MLEKIEYHLSGEWEKRFWPLLEKLESEGVRVRSLRTEEGGAGELPGILETGEREYRNFPGTLKSAEERRRVLFVTDREELASLASGQGVACIGVAEPGGGFFRGADLVVESFEGLDRRELEEYLLRFHGLPVTIARTGRLTLREMVPQDFETLYRISRQRGMERARKDREGENSFHPKRLAAYVRQAYRLYGYGLWSVVGREAQVIGCCGFAPAGPEEAGYITLTKRLGEGEASEEEAAPALEMEYMLEETCRRQGLGTEMCRAALEYARDRLEVPSVQVSVHPQNLPALQFARSLGFR